MAAGRPYRCPRCRTDFIGTPTADGRRKCRNCLVVWTIVNNHKKLIWVPERTLKLQGVG